jgi:hypothetical protein
MIPFYTRFPELAARETRCIRVILPGGKLPIGEYGFIEHYCSDVNCDCRRVLLLVTAATSPQIPLAWINFGWESAEFYTQWMHGDEEAGEESTDATLDPLQTQSPLADGLLEMFRKLLMTDADYVARLARHYAMFKQDLRDRPNAHALVMREGQVRVVARPAAGPNEPCPCGTGKKYKKCCGK